MNKCYAPWGYFIVGINGYAVPCCQIGKGIFGDTNTKSIEEIWNGEAYRYLREKVAEGKYQEAGCSNCFLLKIDGGVKPDNIPNLGNDRFSENYKQNMLEYGEGCTSLKSRPLFYTITASKRCNLNCIMCWEKDLGYLGYNDLPVSTINRISPEFAKYARSFVWVGGETFMLKPVLDFIDNFDTSINPYFIFYATTNGTLVDNTMANKLTKFAGVNLIFSIDGATKETYEKIRRGAKYEIVMENLLNVCDKNKFPNFEVSLNYVVMKSNIHEMLEIVKIANKLDIYVSFYQICGTHGEENIFENKSYRDVCGYDKYFEEAIKESEKNRYKDIMVNKLKYIRGLLK